MVPEAVSHYRIKQAIGSGGMADVYLADDTILGRQVAVKVVRADRQSDTAAHVRLLREAKSAAALDHPYICGIHEVGVESDRAFIVMEYVEGETLRDRLTQGPLSVDEALRVGGEIVEALEEAHRKGVVHRDLKPANIMLTRRGHVKVMDFGLAKQLTEGGAASGETTAVALTTPGMVVGTLAYAAPEQLAATRVDARTDLFAFGIVLYEALAGVHPFARGSTMQTVGAILEQPLPPLPQLTPAVPDLLGHVVSKLLAKDPDDRYQSAHEVRTDLGRIAASRGLTPVPPVARPGRRRHRLLRWSLMAMAVVVVGGSTWLAGRYFWPPGTSLAFKERDWILIADWDNRTGDPVFDRGLETAITVSLQQSRYVNVFPRTRVPDTLARMRKPASAPLDENLAREVALREGVKGLLVCRISGTGGEYLATAEVVDPVSQRTVASEAIRAPGRDRILSAVDRLAERTRRRLGESLASIQEAHTDLPLATTTSLEALKALADSRRTEGAQREQLLKQALQLDPDFAMAHADLGVVYTIDNRRPEAEECFKKALSLADRLTVREQLWIRAVIEDWRGNREQGIANYKTYLSQYPDDNRAWFRLGYAYMITGHRREAIQAFEEALRVNPSDASSQVNIASCYNGLREDDKAVAAYERAFTVRPALLTGIYVNREYGFMLVRMGQLDKATQVFQRAIASEDAEERAKGYRSLGLLDVYRGQYANAATHFGEAILLNKTHGWALSEFRDHLYLAQVYRTKRVWTAYDREMAAAQLLMRANAFGPEWVLWMGTELARQGRIQEATRLLQTLSRRIGDPMVSDSIAKSSLSDRASYFHLRGEIETAKGRYDDAIASFQRAARMVDSTPHEPLAHTYRRANKLDQAISNYEEYLKRSRPDRESWVLARYDLAKIYELKGTRDKAIESYEQFVRMWADGDPDLPPLADAKARLATLRAEPAPAAR